MPVLLCAIGAVLFIISDSLIAVDKFFVPLTYRTSLIMITYYLAQLGITLSILEIKPETSVKSKNN